MTYRYLQCPEYVKRHPQSGAVLAIQCKMCGTVIADTIDQIVGFETDRQGQRIKLIRRQLSHFSNFIEIKIEFDDGTFHVTNGCDKCIKVDLDPAILNELHQADMVQAPETFNDRDREKVPIGIAAIKHDQSGIV